MSFDISWVAFNNVRKQDVLAAAGLRDTGRLDEANEEPFSCAALPTGWTILYANDSTYACRHIGLLSANHAVLSLIIQEYVPTSVASFHVRKEVIWSVSHEGSGGASRLTLEGAVPPQTSYIHDRQLSRRQTEVRPPQLDPMYEVPIALAESVCGYRHDRWQFPWGRPMFTIAETIRG